MRYLWVLFLVTSPLAAQSISVIAGTYGGNVGAPRGNDTHLYAACNGRVTCDYVIWYTIIGDPAPGKAKDYVAQFQCGATVKTVTVPAEAGMGSIAHLDCGSGPTPTPTAIPPTPTPGPPATPTPTPLPGSTPTPTPPPTAGTKYNLITFTCEPPLLPCVPFVLRSDQGLNVFVQPRVTP